MSSLYSALPHWGLFLVRPGQKLGPFGISFLIEGIVSVADAEQTGFELGFTPMFKLSALLFPGVLAHIEGGAGLITESIDSPAIAHPSILRPRWEAASTSPSPRNWPSRWHIAFAIHPTPVSIRKTPPLTSTSSKAA